MRVFGLVLVGALMGVRGEITYTKLANTDQSGSVEPIGRIGTPDPCGTYYKLPPCNITYLMDACRSTCGCAGFNSNGWLKGCVWSYCGASNETLDGVDSYVGSARADWGPVHPFPEVDDSHYPPEEPDEDISHPSPLILSLSPTSNSSGSVRMRDASTGEEADVNVGGNFGVWKVLGFMGSSIVVIEAQFSRWSLMVWSGVNGDVRRTRSGVGMISGVFQPTYSPEVFDTCWESRVALDPNDFLFEVLHNSTAEPSFSSYASLLPPSHDYAVIGNPEGWQKWVVSGDGWIKQANEPIWTPTQRGVQQPGVSIFSAFNHTQYWPSVNFTNYKSALLGRHARVVVVSAFDRNVVRGFRLTAFSAIPEQGVMVCLEETNQPTKYFLANNYQPTQTLDRGIFYAALLDYLNRWDSYYSPKLYLPGQEGKRLVDSAKSTMTVAMTVYTNVTTPNYGVGLDYWSNTTARGGSLPLTTLDINNALLGFQQVDAAANLVGYYFDTYVTDSGVIEMTGWKTECPFPDSIADYGRMLHLFVEVARATIAAKQPNWVQEHWPRGKALIQYTLNLQATAANNTSSPSYAKGLLKGPAEHDTCQDEDYYFSISAWTWRGLVTASRWLEESGLDDELGAACKAGAAELRAALDNAIAIAKVDSKPYTFYPPIAGPNQTQFFTMTESVLASYSNFRYFPETLMASAFNESVETAILEFRRHTSGFVSGMARWSDHVDQMPQFGTIWSTLLWQDEDVDRSANLLIGHAANYLSRGVFGGTEQLGFRGLGQYRAYLAPPAERDIDVIGPTGALLAMQLRWSLLFVPYDEDLIHICRGCLRRWYSSTGLETIPQPPTNTPSIVLDGSTRYGNVSFSITPSSNDDSPASYTVAVMTALSGKGFINSKSVTFKVRIRDPLNQRTIQSAKVMSGSATVTSTEQQDVSVTLNSGASFTLSVTMTS